MNIIPGVISSVLEDDLFAKIDIEHDNINFSACILNSECDATFSKPGTPVNMAFKETDTIISLLNDKKISCRNRFPSKVTSIVYGVVMTRIAAAYKGFTIVSLVTSSSARQLNLRPDISVICMVKSTSMILSIRKRD